ncbi:hypothetical protein B0H13DRAFT_2389740 [Mycena leptocephala]|nr:hypothetical protein B0H13DRAFT_2389740 [Mycena leptocephala]
MNTPSTDDILVARDRQLTVFLSLPALGKWFLLTLRQRLTMAFNSDPGLRLPAHFGLRDRAHMAYRTETRVGLVHIHPLLCSLCNIVMFVLMFGDFAFEVSESVSFLQTVTDSAQTCNRLNTAHGLIVVQQLAVGCTLILRVYAMYNCSKKVLCLLLFLSICTVGLGTWSALPSGPAPTFQSSITGCLTLASKTQAMRMAAAWEAELACEILVLGLTIRRVMYFGVICLANLANILMLNFGNVITASNLASLAATISVVMISRLMLNLREAASSRANGRFVFSSTYLQSPLAGSFPFD